MIDSDECKRLNSLGWSHRQLMAHFKVPLRHVQKALDPEKRREMDRTYAAKRPYILWPWRQWAKDKETQEKASREHGS